MAPATYSFEGISVDVSRMTVTRAGLPVSLEPKALDVLLFLVEHRDRLVTKEELLDAVWKDTFVTPNVLTRAVAQLRKALGDDAEEPRIIETAARRGYRFIAPVQRADAGPSASGVETPRDSAPPTGPAGRVSSARRAATLPWLLAGMGALAVLAVVAWFWLRPAAEHPVLSASDVAGSMKRLSTRAGYNGHPAMSPNGRAVAYSSDQSGALEIWIRGLISTGTESQLTSNGGQNVEPNWSPDGQWIAFHSRQFGGIWVVPAAGGTPQQVADFGSSPSWAPDSDQMVFTSNAGGFLEQSTLWVVRRDGSDRHQIMSAEMTPGGATDPAWSHNGRFIAFINFFTSERQHLRIFSVADRRILNLKGEALQSNPAFSPDDRWLYSFTLTGNVNLAITRTPIDPLTGQQRGDAEPLMPVTGLGNGLSVAHDGTLAYSLDTDDDNLWRIDVGASSEAGAPVRLTNDTVRNYRLAYSSTGVIAHQQLAAGHPVTTWILDAQGRREPLLPDTMAMNPQWSADGKRLLILQGSSVFWVDLATRRKTPVPMSLEPLWFPRLSPDDLEVAYHRIGEDGKMRAWIQPLDGKPARLLAEDPEGVGFPVWSPDGKRLAVEIMRGDRTFIGIVPRGGGAPIDMIVSEPHNAWPHSWSPDGKQIAFAGERHGVWNVWVVDVATRATRQLTRFTLPIGYVRYPVWSPTGDHIVFERQTESAIIWTLKTESTAND